ncbi:DUF3865 domain-containing protein [Nostoc sp. 'Peltigera malacea cyanobiont' DB3992]|uniref:DUF3865 domain-containing protein n=1 Tax=Nostoc sp. 'Peltigera malacea cyanobiont' DB3992 TaxID=1206980 RepID=UPI000C052D64|nr:DUF3865 domain-containing protein [Nostoc sp. 'Peltigera malacea cyanobiont' DB3992]PHM08601.1 hypothetical protein CK516_19805 [Nostoc sp. 'Peltigera malacea cyanobiont' DB3992]
MSNILMEFNHLTKQLNQLLAQDYVAFSNTENPVIQILNETSFAQIAYVMQQYSIFPKELVCFTELARQKALAAGWNSVAQELKENIAEEMGSTTQGISHYTLLAEGLEEGLGVAVKNTMPSIATFKLLKTMQSVFDQQMPYVLGATYAIEATSIPELTLIVQLLDWLLEGTMPKDLEYFFSKHLDEWEIEHEAGLRTSLAAYIQPEEFGEFAAGFRATIDAMEAWWQELAQEAISSEVVLSTAIAQ